MMKNIIYALLITVLSINAAHALSLQEAKSKGLIGERTDGYLGYVVIPPSAEVKALVKDVNNKRRAKFKTTAKNNSIAVEKVGARFYHRAVDATKSNHYYQDVGGNWVKK